MATKLKKGNAYGIIWKNQRCNKSCEQANNVELYRQLLDLCSQTLNMQAEKEQLKEENKELRKKNDISKKIICHKESYITINGNDKYLCYCSHCWDSIEKLI